MFRLNLSCVLTASVLVALIAQPVAATVLFLDDFTDPDGTLMTSRGYTDLWYSGGAVYDNSFKSPPEGTDAAYFEQIAVPAPGGADTWKLSVDFIIGEDVDDCQNNGLQLRGNSIDPRWAAIEFMTDWNGTGHFNVITWDNAGTGVAESVLYGSGPSQTYKLTVEVDVANLRMRGLVDDTAGSWRSITAGDLASLNLPVLALDARSFFAGATYDNLLVEEVPEPSALIMLSALAGLGLFVWRKR